MPSRAICPLESADQEGYFVFVFVLDTYLSLELTNGERFCPTSNKAEPDHISMH